MSMHDGQDMPDQQKELPVHPPPPQQRQEDFFSNHVVASFFTDVFTDKTTDVKKKQNILDCLLKAGFDTDIVLEYNERFSYTPLMMAVRKNNLPMVDYLIQKGAMVDKIVDIFSALHVACHHGYIDIAETLLKRGADPNGLYMMHLIHNNQITDRLN